ncbi:DUF2561 family protein [Mycobacterium sp. 1274756.6]|uniref:DUF2561 family protein n=1 Tax=Mycobacterium sp. 1274756.6 TaxID=1834076 RepID=UPI0008014968|nr:DUF2561 family protein [Mycobacterium sp. 1274756.6]OBJ73524.1 hypothetical protein A5643_02940 [Mycobacterium sp. 1274756.6]
MSRKFVPTRISRSPVDTDRILIGVSAVIWLVLLGTGVAAVVSLVNLGQGNNHSEAVRSGHTPWLLYVIAVVSALVILAAIPVLLRARQNAAAPAVTPRQPVRPDKYRAGVDSGGAATEKLRILDPVAVTPMERIWVRGTVLLAIAVGAALTAVAIATNLMAVGRDGVAWGSYAVAGLITAAMPVIPWFFLRQLHVLLDRETE